MDEPRGGDPRRPDGDLVRPVMPRDQRSGDEPEEFGPKVGWGHDAVYRPATPAAAEGTAPDVDLGSPSQRPADESV